MNKIKKFLLFISILIVAPIFVFSQGTGELASSTMEIIDEVVAEPYEPWTPIKIPQEPKTMIISTIERPPFVFKQGDTLRGFSIDLWEHIALDTGIKFEYQIETEFSKMLEHVEGGTVDAAVANITITDARKQLMDFTNPIYNSGLQIVVPRHADLFSVWRPLSDPQIWQIISTLFAVWFIGLNILWLTGRRTHALFRNKYPLGLVDAFEWAVIDQLRKDIPYSMNFQFIAASMRIISTMSLLVIAAVFASYFTVDRLENNITGYRDLFGHTVGVTHRSTAQSFLNEQNIPSKGYASLDVMKRDLENGDLDAIVVDIPVAEFFAHNQSPDKVELIPATFKPEQFGFALRSGHPQKDAINKSLQKIYETGMYQLIYDNWFKKSQ